MSTSPIRAAAAPLPAAPSSGPGRLSSTDPRARAALETALAHLARAGVAPTDVRLVSVDVDELGMTHVRLDRLHEGARVLGEEVVVHLRGAQGVSLTGRTTPLAVEPRAESAITVTAESALATALAAFGAPPTSPPEVERVVFRARDGSLRRGFSVRLCDLRQPSPRRLTYFVDGDSGRIARRLDDLGGVTPPRGRHPASPAATPAGVVPQPAAGGRNNQSLYSGLVALSTTRGTDGQFTLLDTTRGQGIHTRDARNKNYPLHPAELVDADDAWGRRGDPKRQNGAIDAHFGMATTSDMYRGLLGLDSFDLQGGRMNGNVHVGTQYVNAYWDGASMNYGDGDGVDSGPLTTLDVTGHEITHGLVEHTARLVYAEEAGALNESFADIGGFLTEYWAARANPALKWDWAIGEDCWTPGEAGDALRYLDRPTRDGYSVDHYSRYPDQTEVHGASGIANAAFYQLAETDDAHKETNSVSGRLVQGGLGPEVAGRIFFRALQFYLTSSARFHDARTATVQAATNLFGAESVEVQKVKEAWSVVGVEDVTPAR